MHGHIIYTFSHFFGKAEPVGKVKLYNGFHTDADFQSFCPSTASKSQVMEALSDVTAQSQSYPANRTNLLNPYIVHPILS